MAVDWMWGWQFEAACRGEDSSLFFAPNYFEKRDQKEGREAKAKALCARCPVREECLEYALQALSALKEALGSLDRVRGIVQVLVFVASAPGFTDQPKVANGASDLLVQVFGETGKHARAAVGVAELPLGAPVEVAVLAKVD